MISSPRVLAPAKINLTLEILRRRDDGYHGVRSVMVPIGIYDEITVAPDPSGFAFSCNSAQLDATTNLVVQAWDALTPSNQQFRIELVKRIPTQAGMGGGSSDAAAVLLLALNGAFGPMPNRDWITLARNLGSDVPFFLVQTGALVEGTGERVTALGALPPWWCVVVKPEVAISTARAFAWIDERERIAGTRSTSASLLMNDALARANFDDVIAHLQNDFHEVIMERVPEVALTIEALRKAGARHPLLTGSGSACFALARNESEANNIAQALQVHPGSCVFVAPFVQNPSWRTPR